MIDKSKMEYITNLLIRNVFRNPHIMFAELPPITIDGHEVDLVDIIASLHNLLYDCVNGERYDYMFHWANKIGSVTSDNIFDKRGENK